MASGLDIAALVAAKRLPKRRPPKGLPPIPPAPPRGGIVGTPTGQPPWTRVYPPGTIQNMVTLKLR